MTKRSDIPDRLIYTCNCGWLDLGHATSHTARPYIGVPALWKQVRDETGKRSKAGDAIKTRQGFQVIYRQDMGRVIRGSLINYGDVTRAYWVKAGLPLVEKEQVALAIFKDVSYDFEKMQGTKYFSRDSSFSEEDLPSDLIGFYIAVRSKPPTKSGLDYYVDLCGPVSAAASLKVWDTYGSVGSNKNQGFLPSYHPCAECPQPGAFPAEFSGIRDLPKDEAILLYGSWLTLDDVGYADLTGAVDGATGAGP